MAQKIFVRKIIRSSSLAEKTQDRISLERLIFFSDAVFAIAITLLTLDIRLPATNSALSNADMLQSILALGPKFFAFVISFLVIGLIWIGHHRKFRLIQRFDGNLMWINLLLLMTVAFIPFPTSLISTFVNQVSTIIYASVMILASLLSSALWFYASYKNRLIDPHLDDRQRKRETISPLVTMGVFLLSIGLSFFTPDLSRVSWILIAFTQAFVQRVL